MKVSFIKDLELGLKCLEKQLCTWTLITSTLYGCNKCAYIKQIRCELEADKMAPSTTNE